MTQRALATILVTVTLAVIGGGTAAAKPAPAEGWTKTYTEAILLLKLRLPCKSVRSAAGCSVARAEQQLAQSERQLADCKARTTASADVDACSRRFDETRAQTNLADVEHGFPLSTADCTGGPNARVDGRRYGVFRCEVTVDDETGSGGPVVVTGRLLVTVNGKTAFSWQAI